MCCPLKIHITINLWPVFIPQYFYSVFVFLVYSNSYRLVYSSRARWRRLQAHLSKLWYHKRNSKNFPYILQKTIMRYSVIYIFIKYYFCINFMWDRFMLLFSCFLVIVRGDHVVEVTFTLNVTILRHLVSFLCRNSRCYLWMIWYTYDTVQFTFMCL